MVAGHKSNIILTNKEKDVLQEESREDTSFSNFKNNLGLGLVVHLWYKLHREDGHAMDVLFAC